MTKFTWTRDDSTAGWRCEMPGSVTLFVVPDQTRFGKAKRGTQWRAGASQWDGKSTISRFGRDVYMDKQSSAEDAKRLAESVYSDAA